MGDGVPATTEQTEYAMKQLGEEAILALTQLDAGRLDQLLGELAVYQLHPPARAALLAALPGQQVLAALLQQTERNLRLIERSSPCGISQDATGVDVYPAAWQQERQSTTR